MIKNNWLALCGILFLGVSSLGYAQEFPKNFARDSLAPEKKTTNTEQELPTHVGQPEMAPPSTAASTSAPTFSTDSTEPTLSPTPASSDDTSSATELHPTVTLDTLNEMSSGKEISLEIMKKKILSVSLVVSAMDQKDMQGRIEALVGLVDRLNVRINAVYAVGSLAPLANGFPLQTIIEVANRGGVINFPQEPPEEFGIKTGPTWIVQLNNGILVLEGVLFPTNRILAKALGVIEAEAEASALERQLPNKL